MSEHERCPGCGSVVSDRFQSCRPIGVDVTKPGYRYLADTWGYCLHLGRHIEVSERSWIDKQAHALNALADEWDAADEHGNPLREGSLSEAADELRAALANPGAAQREAEVGARCRFVMHGPGDTCDCQARLSQVTVHTSTSTHGNGPDYCAECSAAVSEWVQWPCPARADALTTDEAQVPR